MIKSIAHVCLGAKDLHASERFFCGVLGLKRQFLFKKAGAIIGMYLKVCDGNYIEIFQKDRAETNDAHALRHFCLETRDIDGLYRKLKGSGVETTEKKLGADGSWQIWAKGPDGLSIEFHQYTENSSQMTGKECVLN
jgi:catechol 2,3-dioxygenase-like lactoylglutathione lyase family enzyme